MYKLSSLDLGVQATVAHVAWDGYFNPASVTYLTLSAVIAK